MLLNCGVGEDSWESLGLQGDQTSILKEISPNIHWTAWCWTETPILWPPDVKNSLIGKDPSAGKDWRQEEKGMTEDEMVGWHRWTWVWASFGIWWWTGKSGVLQSVGSQRVRHNWVTELNWTDMAKGTSQVRLSWIFQMHLMESQGS